MRVFYYMVVSYLDWDTLLYVFTDFYTYSSYYYFLVSVFSHIKLT